MNKAKAKSDYKQALKHAGLWVLDLFNPISAIRDMRAYFKKHKKYLTAMMFCITIVCCVQIGNMGGAGWDIGSFIASIQDADYVGGTEIADMLKLETSAPVGGGAPSYVTAATMFKSTYTAIYNVVEPVGIALAVLYWMIGLAAISTRDQFNVETLFQHGIKLIIPVFLISHGLRITTMLVDLSNALIDQLKGQLALPTSVSPTTTATLEEAGFFELLPILLPILVLFLIALIAKIVAYMTVYSRFIRMCIIIGMSPIALADLSGDNHSSSIRLVKKVLALGLQGAIILAINYGGYCMMLAAITGSAGSFSEWHHDTGLPGGPSYTVESITDRLVNGGYDIMNVLTCVACAIVAMRLYSKSEEIANTVVGL